MRRSRSQGLPVGPRRSAAALALTVLALVGAASASSPAQAVPPGCGDLVPVTHTLSNGSLTDDGAVSVPVDGVGAFGGSIEQQALFNPVGALGASGTVYSSNLYLGPPFDDLLQGAAVCTIGDPTATSIHTATDIPGFEIDLVQELGPIASGSSALTQTYTIKNVGLSATPLAIVRHLDGDLQYDGTFVDGGAASFGGRSLFEFEDSANPALPSVFVGSSGALGADSSPDLWTMQPFDYKDDLVANDGVAAADNGVVANDANSDRIVDGDKYYDATQNQQWNAALAPNESVTFTTVTTWGERPPNYSPQAGTDSVSTGFNTPVTVDVQANDADADGDPLAISGFTQGAKGTVSQVGGSLRYAPNAGSSGADAFVYTVSDGRGGTAAATVSVGVAGPPPPPPPPPPPTPAQNVNVTPVQGVILVKAPGSLTFVPLTASSQLPLGTEVDARAGTVELTAARSGGTTDTSRFYDGVFAIAQQAPNELTELRLTQGEFAVCALPAFASAEKNRRPVRRLWGSGTGKFRTRGRYSSATVRGTIWKTEDRCDGTLTAVQEGSVTVRDFGRRKDVLVPAGKSYLAEPLPRGVSSAGCTIFGTAGRDVLRGTGRRDVICGLDGNDVILGLGGNDKLLGGNGNDRLLGGPGNDVLDGGAGNDWLDGQAGADSIRGGPGVDFMVSKDGDRGNDRVNGGAGKDRCSTDAVRVCP